MLRRELPAPVVTIDGDAQKASTLLSYAGAYSVTLSTTLPTIALELHSTYLGHIEYAPDVSGESDDTTNANPTSTTP